MSLIRDLVLRKPGALPIFEKSASPSGEPDYYFIGDPSWLFKTFAPGIFEGLARRVVAVIADSYVIDHSHMTIQGHPVPLITLAEFAQSARGRRAEVIFFFEHNEQFWAIPQIEGLGDVRVTDFIATLDQLGLQHTYKTVREEREWWSAQSAERIRTAHDRLSDDRSRRTLAARIASITSGSRRPLMEVRVRGEHEYFNAGWTTGSFVPRLDETYVDVGAAHGDTVDKFVQVTDGKFTAIHAFEPTPGQYRELERRGQADARIQTYRKAVGDAPGRLTFYDDPVNPFGGNALFGGGTFQSIEVECVRLDDTIDACTLLKMDVEGFETRVLGGARRLISQGKPDLAVTCYHYPQDLFEIMDCVESIHSYKYVALRHYAPSLYDSILLFSDRQSFA